MVFKFLIVSDEVEDFKREIQIDPDLTFADLHEAILKATGFKDGEMASFFLCDSNWEKEQEITLTEMDTSSEVDSYIMDECTLNDYLEDEKQKLMYVFDYMTERAFFMELREIITGQNIDGAVCTKSVGDAPQQFIDFDSFEIKDTPLMAGENFYGDESFDIDELDSEGFDGLDDIPASSEEDLI